MRFSVILQTSGHVDNDSLSMELDSRRQAVIGQYIGAVSPMVREWLQSIYNRTKPGKPASSAEHMASKEVIAKVAREIFRSTYPENQSRTPDEAWEMLLDKEFWIKQATAALKAVGLSR